MKRTLLISALAALVAGTLFAQELPLGEVVPRVASRRDPQSTYALYLPKGYTTQRRWPVIFCFAPDGKGEMPVRLLSAAAERYGYVVAGSNVSKNGPWDQILDAQEALLKEVDARYAVDPGRGYAMGFSGGARAALHLALNHKKRFAGVLSCGAFYDERRPVPRECPLTLVMLIGDEDFNRYELTRAARELGEKGVRHWLGGFHGKHQWPPAGTLESALGLWEAGAMAAGAIPRDESSLDNTAARQLLMAEALARAGWDREAWRTAAQTASWFPGTPSGERAGALAAQYATLPGCVAEAEVEPGFEALHLELAGLSDVRRFTARLREIRAALPPGGGGASGAPLLLRYGTVRLYETGMLLLQMENFDDAARAFDTLLDLEPSSPLYAYNAACCYARSRQKAPALARLQTAVDNGFDDGAALEKDPDLSYLRSEPAFKALAQRLRETPPPK